MNKEMISPGCSLSELTRRSLSALKGHWFAAFGALFIPTLIQFAVNKLTAGWGSFFLIPLTFGPLFFFLNLLRQRESRIVQIFEPMKDFQLYLRFLWAYFRSIIFVLLWSLLLIIPGIIAAYRYAMVYYILWDNPNLSVKDAMAESSQIMYGHKMRFCLYSILLSLLAFIGTILTLGIGLFWLLPFLASFWTAFYESIRRPE